MNNGERNQLASASRKDAMQFTALMHAGEGRRARAEGERRGRRLSRLARLGVITVAISVGSLVAVQGASAAPRTLPDMPSSAPSNDVSYCYQNDATTCPQWARDTVDGECSALYANAGLSSPNCTTPAFQEVQPIFYHTPQGPRALNAVTDVVHVVDKLANTTNTYVNVGATAAHDEVNQLQQGLTLCQAHLEGSVSNGIADCPTDLGIAGGAVAEGGPPTGSNCPVNSTWCNGLVYAGEGTYKWTCCQPPQGQGWYRGEVWYDAYRPATDMGDGNVYDYITTWWNLSDAGDALCTMNTQVQPAFSGANGLQGFVPAGTTYTNGGSSTVGGSVSYNGVGFTVSYSTQSQGYVEGDWNPGNEQLSATWSVGYDATSSNHCSFNSANLETGNAYQTPANLYPPQGGTYDLGFYIQYTAYEDCC